MTTYDVLRAARAYLLEHGWLQGAQGLDGGPRCAVSAMCSVGGAPQMYMEDGSGHWSQNETLCDAYAVMTEAAGRSVPFWNDQPERTFDEVIAAFDAAIEATAPLPAEAVVA